MKLRKILFSGAFSLIFAFSVSAQTGSFSDINVEYTFELPETTWKQTVKPSSTSPNVEYVYNDRSEGHFDVRRVNVKTDDLFSDVIKNEEQRLQFQTGYVVGKEEDFRGALNGRVLNYEFVRAGRNMSGRLYFLRADDKTVYILRFTGQRDKLRSIRNQSDSIARTFSLKKSA